MAHFSSLSCGIKKINMKTLISTLALFLGLVMVSFTTDQSNLDQVIGAMKDGKANEVGKFMDDNIELTLPDKSNSYSKAQAIEVLKDFFDNNEVKGFEIKHKGGQEGGEFCVGTLQTKSGNYRTTIFMKSKTGKNVIREIRFQSV
jgi:Domain of unknown function (DUF4783)